jgi:hypothetical protein
MGIAALNSTKESVMNLSYLKDWGHNVPETSSTYDFETRAEWRRSSRAPRPSFAYYSFRGTLLVLLLVLALSTGLAVVIALKNYPQSAFTNTLINNYGRAKNGIIVWYYYGRHQK